MADENTTQLSNNTVVGPSLPIGNTSQLIQFDWRVVTTIGCSSASVIPNSNAYANGMPLLQLTMETSDRSDLASSSSSPAADDVGDYMNKYPSSADLNAGSKPSDRTRLWELNASELDEVIARLQGALTVADKACPPSA